MPCGKMSIYPPSRRTLLRIYLHEVLKRKYQRIKNGQYSHEGAGVPFHYFFYSCYWPEHLTVYFLSRQSCYISQKILLFWIDYHCDIAFLTGSRSIALTFSLHGKSNALSPVCTDLQRFGNILKYVMEMPCLWYILLKFTGRAQRSRVNFFHVWYDNHFLK